MHSPSRYEGPLGGQQALRLRRLRTFKDQQIQERHRSRERTSKIDAIQPGNNTQKQPVNADTIFKRKPPASRTVEAIIEARAMGESHPKRIRERIQAARGGMQTERTDRDVISPNGCQKSNQHEPLLPHFDDEKRRSSPTTPEHDAHKFAQTMMTTRRKIVAVRRRMGHTPDPISSKRKLSKEELEWIEKQLQLNQRISVMEKECTNWWQNFYRSSMGSAVSLQASSSTTAVLIQKQQEEEALSRAEEYRDMKNKLQLLRQEVWNVSRKIEEMKNGCEFVAELQDMMDSVEESLAKFRMAQRDKFDQYVMEEKLLEKELREFMDKLDSWDEEARKGKVVESRKNFRARSANELTKHRTTGAVATKTAEAPIDEDDSNYLIEDDDTAMVERVRQLNEMILQSGGLKGGWDDREHAQFTSLLLKCGLSDEILLHNQHFWPQDRHEEEIRLQQNGSDYETTVARFLRKCTKKIVTQTSKSIRHHLHWYLGHIQMIQERKSVLQEWKQKKQRDRQQMIQHVLDTKLLENNGAELLPNGNAVTNTTLNDQERRKKLDEEKARRQTQRLLEDWKGEKERKEQERIQQERELQKQRQAEEAKRRQHQLDAKQKILLYKLRKEQDAEFLGRNGKQKQSKARSPQSASPTLKEDLKERSRIAIETAKAKREKLQLLEEQKQQKLPPRPKSTTQKSSKSPSGSPTDDEVPSPTLHNATEASKAKDRSKLELRRKEKERKQQNAHNTLIPGAAAISDVKVKSFGHIPIQPRAIPTWRRNI